ncbi:MAG: hypothetical protein KAS81_09345, partial [Anaerolineales bacterium]|nr:hypothetical protein [Anaerolineales bacterium]
VESDSLSVVMVSLRPCPPVLPQPIGRIGNISRPVPEVGREPCHQHLVSWLLVAGRHAEALLMARPRCGL